LTARIAPAYHFARNPKTSDPEETGMTMTRRSCPLPMLRSTPRRKRHMKPSRPGVLTALLAAATSGLIACGAAEQPRGFEDLAAASQPQIDGEIPIRGLRDEVRILRDEWGVPHIYAQNLDDLFFAQGFVQAQDRLWQMEMWRRIGEGRLAEILGPDALEHDRLARLVKYRGPWDDTEFSTYHPEGRRIVSAFAAGVNAFMEQRRDELPVEFRLTGVEPEPWDETTPLPRLFTAQPLGNARAELQLALDVAELGTDEANRRASPDPWKELTVPEGLDVSIITEDVVRALSGFQSGMPTVPLLPEFAGREYALPSLDLGPQEPQPGSNNWAVSGALTATGQVMVANDPHRGVTNPSLRYLVPLDAPGWTAIGSTEPGIPGVAIGHNGRVAWGLTVVGTDQADVFVEHVNPENPNEVLRRGEWEPLRVEIDTIQVRGGETEVVELKFSRHGPIFYQDTVNHRAYAIRSTMHEPGSAGYLGSLRLNQVDDCREFLDELAYYYAPSENMVCGDADGNIAWMAAALTPDRSGGWYGRLPVPGTGAFEWTGFRADLPMELNPDRQWIATANHNIHPPDFEPPLFFKTGPPYPRYERLDDVFSGRAEAYADSGAVVTRSTYTGRRKLLPWSVNSSSHTASCVPGEHELVTWFAGLSVLTVPSTLTRAPPRDATLTKPESEPSVVPGGWFRVTRYPSGE
jgi:penicillin G amidase